jgi:RNA polymerase sigma-70 factor, ECF subfamily
MAAMAGGFVAAKVSLVYLGSVVGRPRLRASRMSQELSLMAENRPTRSPATLGDVLYAKSKAPVPEREWATLVQSIQLALHGLYERAHRIVFTLIMRITANRETAEELTIDVFHDVWRRASRYDAASGTVLAWVMNQARSRAIDRLRFESRKKRTPDDNVQPLAEVAADPRDGLRCASKANCCVRHWRRSPRTSAKRSK